MEIVIENLQKKYGKKNVIDNVSMKIGMGAFGLLGENGAGKSTLMKILATISPKTDGNIIMNGTPISDVKKIRSMVGYLPQDFTMYKRMSVIQALDYCAILSVIPKKERKDRINMLLEKLNLTEKSNEKVKNLSGGMLRRLGIAQAMLNNPDILIIDEPTAGLDPEERIRIRNILCEIGQNRIVILSTHIVEDIEMTCSEFAILSAGKLCYFGNLEQLLLYAKGKVYLIEVEQELVEEIKTKYKVINIQYRKDKAYCRVISESIPGFPMCEPVNPTLEDAYIAVLGGDKNVIG